MTINLILEFIISLFWIFLQDKNGNLWFSSWNGGGVWRYDGKTFKNYLPSADYYLRNEDGRSNNKKRPAYLSLKFNKFSAVQQIFPMI